MDAKYYIENTDLTLDQITKATGLGMKAVRKVWATYPADFRKHRKAGCYRRSKLGDLNPMLGKRGEDHHAFIGAVSDNKGYLMELKPAWYTGRAGSKHVFQHHIVVCLSLGLTAIPKGWVVHHCNFITVDNSIDNLVLLTAGDHRRLHSWLAGATTISKESTLKWVEAHGTPFRCDDIVCSAWGHAAVPQGTGLD
ncbi:HNH nuclease [uncultured Caudovirales phage]|uniref:HNH nuclease n=1 Tax=uncultured Caudovirales phage TaxID=2100421 RepID=A0A6J5TBU6_9CAUD|nr:HNH nuclease [uncultured Caudovirales phage]